MLKVIDGVKGSGKTWLMTHLIKVDEYDRGIPVKANYRLKTMQYRHWTLLNEIFGTTGHAIGIDEGQKIFHCRRAMALPLPFMEMVAGDRHDLNTIYITTQNFTHIDKNVRDNTNVLYTVRRLFRWPINEQRPAIIQLSCYSIHDRYDTPSGLIKWRKKKTKFFIIHKWAESLYDTYEKISLSNYIWRIKMKKGKPLLKIVGRSLIEAGRKRL